MRLGGEVHQQRHLAIAQNSLGEPRRANVSMHELESTVRLHRLEAGEIAGVGECVEDDDAIGRVRPYPVLHEVGADEAGAPAHQQASHAASLRA